MVSATPKVTLNKKEKAKAKVALSALVAALTFQRCAASLGIQSQEMLVVKQLSVLIDELIVAHEGDRREAFIQRVQLSRVKLSKKAENLDAGACLLAAVDVFCGPIFISRPGTRFDFIRAQLRKNIEMFKENIEAPTDDVTAFTKLLVRHINDI